MSTLLVAALVLVAVASAAYAMPRRPAVVPVRVRQRR